MKKYLTSIILTLTIAAGEMHTFWRGDPRVQNWILTVRRPMLVEWNIKFVSIQACFIMYFLAWLFYRPNGVNRTTVVAFFWFAIFDTIMYFYNYKIQDFGLMYFWFAGFWVLSYFGNGKNQRANETAN